MTNVNFEFKGAYCESESSIEIILGRQGVTTTRNCAHPRFFVEIGQNYKETWSAEIHYSNDPEMYDKNCGQIYKRIDNLNSELEAIEAIKEHAAALAKKTITLNPHTIHYCYGWKTYDYENDDLFLSPVVYEASTDTIRHYPTNYCLVAFNDGKFSRPVLEVDKAADHYLPEIVKALKGGFHECDTKKGDDHCKRRLAWLVGCYIAKTHNEGRATWCNLDMTKSI